MAQEDGSIHWSNKSGEKGINDLVIRIATPNGSGSASANTLLYKSIFRMGIPVSAKNIFPSNIQGLPTWFEVRANGDGHTARSPQVDVLAAMNPRTMKDDFAAVNPDGYFLYDSTRPLPQDLIREDINVVPVPLTDISVEAFPDPKVRILMKNITYVGALAALLNIDLEVIRVLLVETYGKKQHLIDANLHAVNLAHQWVRDNTPCPLPIHLEPIDATEEHILIDGNTAAALGCLYAGATVAGWYPITPATSIIDAFHHLCDQYRKEPGTEKNRVCIVQAEDEMAAVGIALGAGWNGARAFTPTSGPGLSLMAEFIGFGYHAEIPFVVFDVQRAGPSTGMPTRTQQADIMTAAYASHGDTKHIVLFPSDPEECFYFSVAAFDLAERFQTPVLVLSDLDIGVNQWMCPTLEWDDSYRPDRGKVLGREELEQMKAFYRYVDTDGDGICYRTVPGVHPKGAFFTRGTSHNQYGQYSERGEDYVENIDRIRRKVYRARTHVPPPITRTQDRTSTFGVLSVGGCDLAVREGLERLAEEGFPLDYMRIRAFPFGPEVEKFIATHSHVIVVEQNRDAQLRSLLILETQAGKDKLSSVLNYGGMPLDAESVVDGIRERLSQRGMYELYTETQNPSPQIIGK